MKAGIEALDTAKTFRKEVETLQTTDQRKDAALVCKKAEYHFDAAYDKFTLAVNKFESSLQKSAAKQAMVYVEKTKREDRYLQSIRQSSSIFPRRRVEKRKMYKRVRQSKV